MSDEVAIICSRADPASLNIAERLQELAAWEDHGGYSSFGPWRRIIHDERQTALQDLDARLTDLGLHPKMVVFACRHVSQAGVPWFGGHFTGMLEDGSRRLSAAAPSGLRSFLFNIRRLAPQGIRVSAEATHHGPTDMKTPSFFAEIGSSELQWRDPLAGEAVARALLGLQAEEMPVCLGFGGGHYVPRQTDLMFGADIAFGHLFSSHQTGSLDAEMVEEARRKSGAAYAYLDRKSLPSREKKRIAGILEGLGIPLLKGKEIMARFPLSSRPAEEMSAQEVAGG
jgi:D-aminoacyl-tRNA deacylase